MVLGSKRGRLAVLAAAERQRSSSSSEKKKLPTPVKPSSRAFEMQFRAALAKSKKSSSGRPAAKTTALVERTTGNPVAGESKTFEKLVKREESFGGGLEEKERKYVSPASSPLSHFKLAKRVKRADLTPKRRGANATPRKGAPSFSPKKLMFDAPQAPRTPEERGGFRRDLLNTAATATTTTSDIHSGDRNDTSSAALPQPASFEFPRASSNVGGGVARGVKNLGNTCWLGSTVTALLHLKEFAALLEAPEEPDEASVSGRELPSRGNDGSGGDGLLRALGELSRRSKAAGVQSLDPSKLLAFFPNLSNGGQEDAFEFFGLLLEEIEKEGTRGKKLAELFSGQILHEFTCQKCAHRSVSKEPFNSLSFHLGGGGDMQTLLEREYGPAEVVEKACDKCKGNRFHSKTGKLEACPRVLCLHLKRLLLDQKVDSPVSTPLNLVAKAETGAPKVGEDGDCGDRPQEGAPAPKTPQPAVAAAAGGKSYRLDSVISHLGSARSGHYICHTRTDAAGGAESRWYCYNDDIVSKSSGSSPSNSYMMFYCA